MGAHSRTRPQIVNSLRVIMVVRPAGSHGQGGKKIEPVAKLTCEQEFDWKLQKRGGDSIGFELK